VDLGSVRQPPELLACDGWHRWYVSRLHLFCPVRFVSAGRRQCDSPNSAA
jgi:hypothetical protein